MSIKSRLGRIGGVAAAAIAIGVGGAGMASAATAGPAATAAMAGPAAKVAPAGNPINGPVLGCVFQTVNGHYLTAVCIPSLAALITIRRTAADCYV